MKVTEENIIQYFENELSSEAKLILESEINQDSNAKELYDSYKDLYNGFETASVEEVPSSLQSNFDNFLKQQISQTPKKTNPYKAIVPVVITCLFLTAVYFFYSNKKANQKLHKQMIAMNDNIQSLMNNESSAYRIKAVKLSAEMPTANKTAIKLLLDAVANDPSSNVRLSALEALEQHIQNDRVRASIYKTMSSETDPIVLLTYVNILTNSKEESSPTVLRGMTENDALDQFIKDEAHLGLFKLEQY